jgi:signal transduction histidine kinase/AraC-like DNA-binding protein
MITYESHEDIAELRRDALVNLLMTLLGGWMITFVVVFFYMDAAQARWPLSPLFVALGALFAANVLRQRAWINAAAWTLIGGLLCGPGLWLWLQGPSTTVAFFLIIPIVVTSVLIGGRAEFGVAGVATAILFITTAAWQPQLDRDGVMSTLTLIWIPGFTYFLVAGITHLNTRNILTMVAWAIDNQQKDARRAALFYTQSEQLKQTLQQLEYANGQLRLLNTELTEARGIAEAANQHKTRFLANVSHELRTPLSIILGHSQVGVEAPNVYDIGAPLALLHSLGHIHRSADHLTRLINDLLDLSQAEIGVLELCYERIDTRAFLEDVFQSMASGGRAESEVRWRLDLPARLPMIEADLVRLRQIVLNLLNNAAKFTPHGQITLGAEVALPHLHLWVADTGVGIPLDVQEQIFQPFVTGEASGRRKQGIGLGLSIARRLVELHHGSMTLESQPDHGSAFHLYLPLPSMSDQPVVLPQVARPALLLLSARDEPSAEIVELSRRQGVALRRIGPDDEITALLAEVSPVGLVWEISQEAASDWPVVQHIRSHAELCRLPLILYSHEQDADSRPALGLTDVLIKPISGSALVKTVHHLQQPDAQGPILIVDDDPQARAFYQQLLTEAFPNYTVCVAEDGAAALQMLAQEAPSLVVLDLMMPNVDGFAVLQHLRTTGATKRTPVLVLSGRMLSFEDVERLNYARVTLHTKELLSSGELETQLRQLLSGDRQLGQPTSMTVKRAVAYLQQRSTEPFSRQELAAFVGVSERYLTHVFQEELGMAPRDYVNRYRIVQAKALLRSTNKSISAIAGQVGFDDPSYFSRAFRKEVGMTPAAYREQADAAPLLPVS